MLVGATAKQINTKTKTFLVLRGEATRGRHHSDEPTHFTVEGRNPKHLEEAIDLVFAKIAKLRTTASPTPSRAAASGDYHYFFLVTV